MSASLKHLSADGATQITGELWPDIYAGAISTARKYAAENNGDRAIVSAALSISQVGSNDGNSMARIGADTATLSRPYSVTATMSGAGAGGVWGATGTYGYKVTATNATGETMPCDEVSAIVDVTTKKVTLSWTQVAGATGYKIYRTATPGSYGASTLRATIASGSTVTYTDDGSATGAGTPPTTNTTGGAGPIYGTPPTLGTPALTIGNLAIGQQFFYWVNWVVPGGTPDAGNPRLFDIMIAES